MGPVTIERSRIWLAPLPAPENGFPAGTVPGENAVDTKVGSAMPRATITIRDTIAWGFRGGLLANMAAFNLKENISATVDRVTVYDSEIAFRLRGAGAAATGAWVTVKNAVVYDVTKAFRYEDNIQNLKIWNSTIGKSVTSPFQAASSGSAGLDVRNLLLLGGTLPSQAAHPSNRNAGPEAFVKSNANNYGLVAGSTAIDAGVAVSEVRPIERARTDRREEHSMSARTNGSRLSQAVTLSYMPGDMRPSPEAGRSFLTQRPRARCACRIPMVAPRLLLCRCNPCTISTSPCGWRPASRIVCGFAAKLTETRPATIRCSYSFRGASTSKEARRIELAPRALQRLRCRSVPPAPCRGGGGRTTVMGSTGSACSKVHHDGHADSAGANPRRRLFDRPDHPVAVELPDDCAWTGSRRHHDSAGVVYAQAPPSWDWRRDFQISVGRGSARVPIHAQPKTATSS